MTTSTRLLTLVLALPLLMGVDVLRSKNRNVEEGNAQLKEGKAEDALARYDKAAAKLPNDPAVRFNRGGALSALGRHEDAALEFLRATEAKTPTLKAAAFYNLGNSFFHAQKYGESIEAYKRSLALNPTDMRAKWNLELALKKKQDEDKKKSENDKQKSEDRDKGQNKDKNEDQQKDDQKQDQQKQDQQKPENQQQKPPEPEPESKPQDPQTPDQKQSPAEPPKPEDTPADMREIDAVLDSLERSPKDLEKERARLRAVRRRPPQKDW